MMTLETLIEEIGPFGRFQKLMIPLNYSSVIMSVMSMMFMIFGVVEPDWWCESSRDINNQSHISAWNSTNGVSLGGTTFPSMDYDISNSTGSLLVESSTKACEAVRRGDGTCDRIVFSPGMNTVVTEFQLVCDLSWVTSFIISLQMVGVFFGAALGGQLADSIGRKKTTVIFTALHVTFNIISAFSVSWQMFAVLRTLIGATVGGLIVASVSYPTEFLGVKWRALVTTIPFWGIGSVLYSLLCWVLPHWMYLHLAIAACSLACLPAWIFLPESVRWLVVKCHVTKAHRVLCKMAKWNGRKLPNFSSVQALCSDIDHTQKKYNYFHIFSTRQMIKTSCLSGFMWISSAMTYYGISFGIKNLSGDFHLNFFLMVLLEIPANLVIFHLTKWLGRRWAIFSAMLLVSLSLLAVIPITLVLPESRAGIYVTVLCIVARFCLSLGWGAMILFHVELYPTVVRNIGLGYCNMVSRFGAIIAPYLLSMREPYQFYALIGGTMALTAIAPLLLPETRGRPLHDNLHAMWEEKDDGKENHHHGEELKSVSA